MTDDNIGRRLVAKAGQGLRERKKAERRTAILEAARASFSTKGFDDTSIEGIAEAAEVSVGTVYNYFTTKSDLLFEMLLTDMRPVIEAGAEMIARTSPGAELPVARLLEHYFRWLDGYDRSLLRRFTAEAILSPHLDDRSYYYLEVLLTRQITTMIRALQRSGEIRTDVEAETVAGLVFNLANSEFYAYLADDRCSAADVRTKLDSQLELLSRGLL